MRRIVGIGKYVANFLLVFAGTILLYLAAAYGLSKITVNADFTETSNGAVEIFVRTNGVHTDIVLPLTHELKDWKDLVNPELTDSGLDSFRYVAFGWGDREFYLETPTWADLKFETAFKALFFLSSSALHVSFYQGLDEDKDCKKVSISRDQYLLLTDYITKSFTRNNNQAILIQGLSYGKNDLFYEANGSFTLFFTCNTWTNSALKHANLKACLWTPFDREILNKY